MALEMTFGAVIQDLRYGLRQLAKNKGATATITISLALGLDSTTAMFSLMNALLFKALPVPDPQRLFAVTHGADGEHGPSISYPAFLSLERGNREVANVFAFGGYQARFREGEADRKISLEWSLTAIFKHWRSKRRSAGCSSR